jgi:hypothetical protein
MLDSEMMKLHSEIVKKAEEICGVDIRKCRKSWMSEDLIK